MTENQLRYLAHQENVRHNMQVEEDADLSRGIAQQDADTRKSAADETARSNLAREAETYRSNVARENETRRSNMADETLDRNQYNLQVRRQILEEALAGPKLAIDAVGAAAKFAGALK